MVEVSLVSLLMSVGMMSFVPLLSVFLPVCCCCICSLNNGDIVSVSFR